MPLEQTNQSHVSNPVTQIATRPQASDIQKSLVEGTSIMDFVAKNTPGYRAPDNTVNTVIQQDVNQMAQEKEAPITTVRQEPDVIAPDVTVEEPEEEDVVESSQEEEPEQQEDIASDDDEDDDEDFKFKGSASENFKKLRTKLKEVKNETKQKDELLTQLTEELKAYSEGKKIPEELTKRESRIAELEQYEKLLNLKKSKYYQDNFVQPLEGIKQRLESIAKNYNINPSALNEAANMQNEAELNRFLSNNFDLMGASEVKQIVGEYKTLQAKAAAAEKEPAESLNRMIESAAAARQQAKVRQLEAMQDVTRDAWRESLDYIKDEGRIKELMYKEGDIEHNTQVFTPIVKAAAAEYGKLVNNLAKNGLETLPQPLAYALSRLCQLAHASAVSIDSRERAVQMAEEISTNSKRTQKYVRPSVSGKVVAGSNRREGAGAGGGPNSPMEAATQLLNQISGR